MKLLIAGGGTGGHLYPGIALAEELTTRQKGNEVLFVGTERGLEAKVVPKLGFTLSLIQVKPLKGGGIGGVITGLLALPSAILASRKIIKEFKPDVAVGVGGYASGPALLAAWMARVPSIVLEQNTIPGFTNRMLGKLVDHVFVAFESSTRYFPPKKAVALGNPIRRSLLDNFLATRSQGGKFTVLVLGGSQGAHMLNLKMAEAAPFLGLLADRMRVVHQTGERDQDTVRDAYAKAGIEAEVKPFIEDMSAAYQSADLVVCRAGATTIAELGVVKRAAILVPYPFAADNHQVANAQELVSLGAGLMFEEATLEPAALAQEIVELESHRDRLTAMEKAAGRAGRPEAGREIIDVCAELAKKGIAR